jgi:hypothetical protein
MTDEEPGIDLPEGWKAETYELTGNFKLVAEFEHEESGAEVRCTPYKTYSQPGFCNAHRVILVHPEDGVEEIAVGMEVELVEDAEEAAREAIEQV